MMKMQLAIICFHVVCWAHVRSVPVPTRRPATLDCFSSPTKHGCVKGRGACVALSNGTVGAYYCRCYAPFTGRRCKTKLEPCYPNPCLFAGTCTPRDRKPGGKYQCACAAGRIGKNCEKRVGTEITECECGRGGTCEQTANGKSVCKCSSHFTGARCNIKVHSSQEAYEQCRGSNPCLFGGRCLKKHGEPGHLCVCPRGTKGAHCEKGGCPHGLYGVDCTRRCARCKAGRCKRRNGECEQGCVTTALEGPTCQDQNGYKLELDLRLDGGEFPVIDTDKYLIKADVASFMVQSYSGDTIGEEELKSILPVGDVPVQSVLDIGRYMIKDDVADTTPGTASTISTRSTSGEDANGRIVDDAEDRDSDYSDGDDSFESYLNGDGIDASIFGKDAISDSDSEYRDYDFVFNEISLRPGSVLVSYSLLFNANAVGRGNLSRDLSRRMKKNAGKFSPRGGFRLARDSIRVSEPVRVVTASQEPEALNKGNISLIAVVQGACVIAIVVSAAVWAYRRKRLRAQQSRAKWSRPRRTFQPWGKLRTNQGNLPVRTKKSKHQLVQYI